MDGPSNDPGAAVAVKPKRTGRRKLEMKMIEKEESRQVCFSKRRSGIFKKAAELSILCGAQMLVIVISLTKKAFVFATPSVQSIINRFRNIDVDAQFVRDVGEGGALQDLLREHNELVAQVGSEEKRRAALMKRRQRLLESCRNGHLWFADVKDLTSEQLEEFMVSLQQMKATLGNRGANLTSSIVARQVPSAGMRRPPACTAGPPPAAMYQLSASAAAPLAAAFPFPSPLLDSMQVPLAAVHRPYAFNANPLATAIPYRSPSFNSLEVPPTAMHQPFIAGHAAGASTPTFSFPTSSSFMGSNSLHYPDFSSSFMGSNSGNSTLSFSFTGSNSVNPVFSSSFPSINGDYRGNRHMGRYSSRDNRYR